MNGEIDSWTTEKDGIKFRFDVDPDYDSDRDDLRANDEGMRDETLAAHGRQEWRYVGVTVTPLIEGTDTRDSLRSVEWGDLPATSNAGIPEDDYRYGPDSAAVTIGRDYIQDVHPGPEMIEEARANLAALRDRLTSLLGN